MQRVHIHTSLITAPWLRPLTHIGSLNHLFSAVHLIPSLLSLFGSLILLSSSLSSNHSLEFPISCSWAAATNGVLNPETIIKWPPLISACYLRKYKTVPTIMLVLAIDHCPFCLVAQGCLARHMNSSDSAEKDTFCIRFHRFLVDFTKLTAVKLAVVLPFFSLRPRLSFSPNKKSPFLYSILPSLITYIPPLTAVHAQLGKTTCRFGPNRGWRNLKNKGRDVGETLLARA